MMQLKMAPTVNWPSNPNYEHMPASKYYHGNAQHYASIHKDHGLQAYLTTVANQAENYLVLNKSNKNAPMSSNSFSGGGWGSNSKNWKWKAEPEACVRSCYDNLAVLVIFSNWQRIGRNGASGSGSPDKHQIWTSNVNNAGKWDEAIELSNHITEYKKSGYQFRIKHFKMMGANVFYLEDMYSGGEWDYNDLLAAINFKTYAPI